MAPPSGYLLLALKANVMYFVAMSAAHWSGWKVPILFIYYDTPYYSYQDKIISCCAATYAILNLAAVKHLSVVPYVIASLALTTTGLCAINSSNDLHSILPTGAVTKAYWLQTGVIGALTGTIALLYAYASTGKKST